MQTCQRVIFIDTNTVANISFMNEKTENKKKDKKGKQDFDIRADNERAIE